MDTVIQFMDYSYAYPDTDNCVLKNINLKIEAGQCHCLTGPTGSGKTTLALATKGLLPPGRQTGEITAPFSPQHRRANVGIVLQNPETQLLMSTVGAEVAFGLESLCIDPALMPDKVERVLSELGLDKPIDFETAKLSMGEKYRLILASHLVMAPNFMVLDEPACQLDPDGLEKLFKIIQSLKGAGIGFLLCENRPDPLHEAIDFFWHLSEDRTIRPGRYPCPASDHGGTSLPALGRCLPEREEVAGVSALTVKGSGGISILSYVSFSVSKGQKVAIFGANGTGKTTLLRCLMGFIQPFGGEVAILGEKPAPGRLRGKVGCLFQNPQRQLFENTVFDEIAFPLKRLGRKGKELARAVREVLALCGIENLAEFSPHKLSYGQKHLVALASVLAPQPELLILDDPFAGLDHAWCDTISKLLSVLNDERRTTIIRTSHDPAQLKSWADLDLCIEGISRSSKADD
jgi:energy-coupling factor transport system ATP-binding protein